jgi:mono/diheme cytochrome c family protein
MRRARRWAVGARARGPMLGLVVMLATASSGCERAEVRSRAQVGARVDSTATAGEGTIYSAAKLPILALGYGAREGRALYRHYCVTCHGDQGMGDGFNAYNLDPRPQSLADSTFQAQHSDSDLVAAIRSGGGAVGLSNQMPPWGRTLSERSIEHIVEYIRTLRESPEGSSQE